ncbi:uncharacterized protein LOC121735354 [Aricia agestis]|uniref:uncharacterized protein LOC121735354 n=1 Tax=Aricia agestis TaxID=91739 RepID=UPI001C208415|nr:uncharacterized protein LOC121735354 [Aricia agestis]
MNKHIAIALVVVCYAALTSAQFGHLGLGYNDAYFGSNFGGLQSLSGAVRDPRANTGPVVFPPSPPGDPSQTSGVVVGASGYGFQPPGAHQAAGSPRYFYRGFFLR